MKQYLMIILTFLLFGCSFGEGNLAVKIERIQTENTDSEDILVYNQAAYVVYAGDSVKAEETARSISVDPAKFLSSRNTEEIPAESEKMWTFRIFNELGELVGKGGIDPEKPYFAFKFSQVGTYSIEVMVITDKDYGIATIEQKVTSNVLPLDWKLSDGGNQQAFVAGGIKKVENDFVDDPWEIDISSIFDFGRNIQSLDLRLLKFTPEGLKAFYFESDVYGKRVIENSSLDYGRYKVVVTVHYYDGSSAIVEDDVTLMDPNNPVYISLTPSCLDDSYENKINVSATIQAESIEEIVLYRTTYCGREEGVHPLGNPNYDGTVTYSKEGKALPYKEEEISVSIVASADEITPEMTAVYNKQTQQLSYLDPMPLYEYDSNGNASLLMEKDFKWTYAQFDREAWKYILRKKMFDLEKAVSVYYKVKVSTDKGPVTSLPVAGVPFLGKNEMMQFAMWAKEVAMNRLWHLQVPRYCYDETSSWLPSGQNFQDAQKQGRVYYGVSGTINKSGNGKIVNYSDFPGVVLNTIDDIYIKVPGITDLKPNQRRDYYLYYSVDTLDLFGKIKCKIDIDVRDFTLQWGMWWGYGTIDVEYPNHEGTIKAFSLNAEEIKAIMPGNNGDYGIYPGYGYDEWDWIGGPQIGVDGNEDHKSTWTRINFKYPPTPGDSQNGYWQNKEGNWSMYYEVN
jgi:hypothetical protein